jgi:hypothetical protein
MCGLGGQTCKCVPTCLQGLNTSNAVTAFERMEEKVMALEAEAESTLQARRVPSSPGLCHTTSPALPHQLPIDQAAEVFTGLHGTRLQRCLKHATSRTCMVC